MEATAAIGHPVAIPIGGALFCENDDPADRRDLRQNVDDMVEHSDAERRPFLRRKQGGPAALALPARFERDNRRPSHDPPARATPIPSRAPPMRSSRGVTPVAPRPPGTRTPAGRS